MSRDRVKRRPKKGKPGRGSNPLPKEKDDLTQDQMLSRIPVDKDVLTTEDIQHIFNNCHKQTVYKMVMRGELKPYRSRNRGSSNIFKTVEVIAAIGARFKLIPAKDSIRGETKDDRNPSGETGKRTKTGAAASSGGSKQAKKNKGSAAGKKKDPRGR